ncbi:MAG: rod shape-determining protein MreC [Candidatus Zixiibacteriota bacterium]
MDRSLPLVNVRKETFLHLLTCLLLSLLFLILPRDFKADVSALVFKCTYGPFYSLSHKIKELEGVREENRKLRLKTVELSVKNSWLNEEHLENQRLRELLEFRPELEQKVIPAEVLAEGPNRRQFSVLIDRGSASGIRRNMSVVNVNGLVGKIVDVSSSSSVVQLMTDPNFRASAQDQKTRVFGIIKPGSGSSLSFDNVPLREDVKTGDRIITSGLGGIFPPGIKIGVVTAVENEEDFSKQDRAFGIFKTVEVTPYVDFSSLEELFVLDAKR